MEIEENGRTYIVTGDYPNGNYAKFLKLPEAPAQPTIKDRLEAIETQLSKLSDIESRLDKLATIESKIDSIKTDTAKAG